MILKICLVWLALELHLHATVNTHRARFTRFSP